MRHYYTIIRNVLDIIPGHRFEIANMFISNLLYNLAGLLPPVATAGIVGVLTNGKQFQDIWFYVVLYLVFYIIGFAILWWNCQIYNRLSKIYYNVAQQKLFDHIVNNDTILEKISKGKIADTCSEDVSQLIYVIDSTSTVVTGIAQLIVIGFIFASYNIPVALFAIATDILYICIMSKNSRGVAKYYEGTRKYNDKIIDILTQMLGSLKQVKSLNIMPRLDGHLSKSRESYDAQYDKKYAYLTSRYCKIPMVVYVGKIILYIYLAYLVANGKMTVDKLVLLISYFEMIITNTDNVLAECLNLDQYSVRVNRIKHILSYTSGVEFNYGDVDNDYINGVVEFDGVDFSIHGREILKNIGFKAMPNEITAIVGRPGSGKTTIVNLLYRLYRVKSGSIEIDNESIYNYNKKVYSSNVSGVFQHPFVFKMSIHDNLGLVDNNIKHQRAALKRVGIIKEIDRLPYGLNTIIDETNPLLTDGQLQKIAIARALLSKAEILLFDEVTSNIDPASAKDVINILKDLKDDHTIIIITHKPELMRIANQVVVLNKGHVSAKGSNADVFAKSALYRELLTAHFAQASVNDDFVQDEQYV